MVIINTLALVMVFSACCLTSCRRKPHAWNVPLPGSYNLTYYEAARADRFYIVDVSDKAIIPPVVEAVAFNEIYIWGRLKSIGDKAFTETPSGLFVINTKTKQATTGLDEKNFSLLFPDLNLKLLKKSETFWKQVPGVYQPKQ